MTLTVDVVVSAYQLSKNIQPLIERISAVSE